MRGLYTRLTTAGAFVGAVVLLSGMLDDGHISAAEWMRLGGVLFIASAVGLSHLLRANPQCIREHDYMLGYENGRRAGRREGRLGVEDVTHRAMRVGPEMTVPGGRGDGGVAE